MRTVCSTFPENARKQALILSVYKRLVELAVTPLGIWGIIYFGHNPKRKGNMELEVQ